MCVFVSKLPSDVLFQFRRMRFTLRIAYAVSVDQAQGHSLRTASVDFQTNGFPYGQLHIACFRAESAGQLCIHAPYRTVQKYIVSFFL
jgi:hypothetical protein